MPENEFEKKVSSELQLLKFKPSEAVWMRVEERIRKKNKRRVFIILFLLAGIAVLGYWQWDNFSGAKDGDIVKAETPVQEKNETVNDNDKSPREDANNSNQRQQKKPVEKSNTDNKKDVSTNRPANKIDNKTNTVSRQIKPDNKKVVPTEQKKRTLLVDKKDTQPDQETPDVLLVKDPPAVTTVDSRPVKDSANIKSVATDTVNQDLNQNITPTTKTDSVKLDTLVRQDLIKKDTVTKKTDSILKAVPADSPVVNIPKKPANKKWSFGIEFTPGISSFHEGFLSFNMNKSAADMSGNPTSGGGSGAGNILPADPVKSHRGFGFQLGAFIKKQFTRRSGLSVGLRWAYYTDEIQIGSTMYPSASSPVFSQFLNASGVSSAYSARNNSFRYTDKYHFIELPIQYHVDLNKSNSHPLTLQAGLKMGQMIGSDALVYDTTAGGIYYKSKKYFNKTQFGISTRMTWQFISNDKFNLAAGPAFDMHLTRLLDNPYDKERYLLFIGLRTTASFRSKK